VPDGDFGSGGHRGRGAVCAMAFAVRRDGRDRGCRGAGLAFSSLWRGSGASTAIEASGRLKDVTPDQAMVQAVPAYREFHPARRTGNGQA
jgi:hypothetical protein